MKCNPLDAKDLARVTTEIIHHYPLSKYEGVVCMEGSLTTCIVASIVLTGSVNGSVVRKPKEHGTQAKIENPQKKGTLYLVIVEQQNAVDQIEQIKNALHEVECEPGFISIVDTR